MAEYKHRKKVDGTWDSICMTCYHTAATSVTESKLRETEALHNCSGSPHLLPAFQAFDFLRRRTD